MTSLEDAETTSSIPIPNVRVRPVTGGANQYGDHTLHLRVSFSTSAPTATISGEAVRRVIPSPHHHLRYQRKPLTSEELQAQLHQRTPVLPHISPADVIRELRDEP